MIDAFGHANQRDFLSLSESLKSQTMRNSSHTNQSDLQGLNGEPGALLPTGEALESLIQQARVLLNLDLPLYVGRMFAEHVSNREITITPSRHASRSTRVACWGGGR